MSDLGKKNGIRFSAEKKLQILQEAAATGQVAETCRRHGITTSQYYDWKKRADEGAKEALTPHFGRPRQDRTEQENERLRQEAERMRRVIAEITAENLDLKKGL